MWSDDFRLSQILIALIENAHQYTPDGGNIIISAEEIADGKRRLIKVAIRNEGKGILPSEESQLFMPFFRSEQEQTRERYGTGLNLYIAKNIVELQGGEMTFENRPGNGMTFYFTVPTNQ